jgi:hypothetical protein
VSCSTIRKHSMKVPCRLLLTSWFYLLLDNTSKAKRRVCCEGAIKGVMSRAESGRREGRWV